MCRSGRRGGGGRICAPSGLAVDSRFRGNDENARSAKHSPEPSATRNANMDQAGATAAALPEKGGSDNSPHSQWILAKSKRLRSTCGW